MAVRSQPPRPSELPWPQRTRASSTEEAAQGCNAISLPQGFWEASMSAWSMRSSTYFTMRCPTPVSAAFSQEFRCHRAPCRVYWQWEPQHLRAGVWHMSRIANSHVPVHWLPEHKRNNALKIGNQLCREIKLFKPCAPIHGATTSLQN